MCRDLEILAKLALDHGEEWREMNNAVSQLGDCGNSDRSRGALIVRTTVSCSSLNSEPCPHCARPYTTIDSRQTVYSTAVPAGYSLGVVLGWNAASGQGLAKLRSNFLGAPQAQRSGRSQNLEGAPLPARGAAPLSRRKMLVAPWSLVAAHGYHA